MIGGPKERKGGVGKPAPNFFYELDGFTGKLMSWVYMFVKKSRKIAQSFVQYWI